MNEFDMFDFCQIFGKAYTIMSDINHLIVKKEEKRLKQMLKFCFNANLDRC